MPTKMFSFNKSNISTQKYFLHVIVLDFLQHLDRRKLTYWQLQEKTFFSFRLRISYFKDFYIMQDVLQIYELLYDILGRLLHN